MQKVGIFLRCALADMHPTVRCVCVTLNNGEPTPGYLTWNHTSAARMQSSQGWQLEHATPGHQHFLMQGETGGVLLGWQLAIICMDRLYVFDGTCIPQSG